MSLYNYDAIVIGGGLMGCASAYALSSRGIKTAIIEKNAAPGLETTARSGAIIRAHYGVPELVALALSANERYRGFKEEIGFDCGFVQSGYTVIVDQNDVQTLKSNIAMQKDIGVDVQLLSANQMAELVPSLIVDDIALAAYEPKGGYANPAATVNAYAKRAEQQKTDIRYSTTITTAEKSGDGWLLTLSSDDQIGCGHVVIATGNWSTNVGALFGVELPVTPVRAQIVVVDRPGGNVPMPVVSDLINLAYFRQEPDMGMWVGSSDMADLQEKLDKPEGYNEVADEIPIDSALKKTALRFHDGVGPYRGGVKRSFTGLYETTPDWQPIIDSFPGGLHVAVGFSGHGFKLAPIIGDVIADFVTGAVPQHNTTIFQLGRYAANRPVKSRFTYQRARFLR